MRQYVYACDRPECQTTVATDNLPEGWLTLRANNTLDATLDNQFELCSNYCLALLAIERAEADGTPISKNPRGKREATSKQIEAARRASHTRHHVNKNVVLPECRYCQEDAAPEARAS